MDLRIVTEPQHGASYGMLLRAARATEDLGFGGFFRSDHYGQTPGGSGDGLPGPTDAWITLAGLARETTRIRLGTLVTPVTFRLPGPLAIQVAQVDAMSGGRIELGLGAGWVADEHSAYGIPFPDHRFGLLEEQLEIITGLWATPAGKTFSFTGQYYQLADSPALPRPVQRPHVPIIVGGGGLRRTPRLAARFAMEYNAPRKPADVTAANYARVREACTAIGRDPGSLTYSTTLVVACGRTDAEIARRAARIAEISRPGQVLKVTPAQLVEQIAELGALGTQRIYFRVLDLADLDQLDLLASEVMRQLRS
ncbi:MAG TPA: LLM class F420-dependent oxidoreductase [Streptosporangiaceae bacterium]|nr:LLM class F420-dependent oxidoreductase [Streptosporangiaceae bacterium]